MPSSATIGPGIAHASHGQTLIAFILSLAVALGIFVVQLTLFIFLRKRLSLVYEPKTILVPKSKRTPAPGASLFAWLGHVCAFPLNDMQTAVTLDEFFFLRFVRMLVILFSISTLILLPVLLPVNWFSGDKRLAVDNKLAAFSLDMLTWSHISPHHAKRLTVHLVLVILLILFICWFIYQELQTFVRIRHSKLTSFEHRQTASANTILLRSIPLLYRSEEKLLDLFSVLPGGVKNVWLNREYSPLLKKLKERDAAFYRLEALETSLILQWNQRAVHARQQEISKPFFATLSARLMAPYSFEPPRQETVAANDMALPSHASVTSHSNSITPQYTVSHKPSFEALDLPGKLVSKYISSSELPRVRLAKAYLFGIPLKFPWGLPSIDALTWYKAELNRLNAEVHQLQENYSTFEPINSCFIQFNNQLAAHLACQAVIFEDPQLSGLSAVEIDSRDIIWHNLNMSWEMSLARHIIANFLNVVLMLGWTFPVAVVGMVSQLDYLPDLLPGFEWIDLINPRLRLILSSILPAIVMSLMMGIAPTLFRALAKFKGYSTTVEISLDVHTYLFPFFFIQAFLVVAISRGTTAVISQVLHLPFTMLTLLAYNVPKGANFFYSYLFLQGLAVSGEMLLQATNLIKIYIYRPLFAKTAHDKFYAMTLMDPLDWGSVYPSTTVLAVIGLVYSVIAPLVTVFAAMSFLMLYLAYKYRILYCNNSTVQQLLFNFYIEFTNLT